MFINDQSSLSGVGRLFQIPRGATMMEVGMQWWTLVGIIDKMEANNPLNWSAEVNAIAF